MIRAIVVDDERPALRELEYMLKKHPQISIIGMYTDPLRAIDEIGQLKPQIVFMDINMPQLRGIDAASRVLEGSPDTDIIFVTSYDEYAVEAFEIHALDYLLKPINAARMEKTVERILNKLPVEKEKDAQKLQIRCFGKFQIGWEHQEPIKLRAEKTRELLAFLLQNQGRDISKDELLDQLWTEYDPDKAIRQLYNGIYYIRKALESYGVDRSTISISSNYNLKLGESEYDVGRFYELEKTIADKSLNGLLEMETLYKGDYFEGEDYTWAQAESERLSNSYQKCLIRLAKLFMEHGEPDEAEKRLKKSYEVNPYEETTTELLVRLYIEKGDKTKAVRHLNSYSSLIKEELGISPNDSLNKLFQSLK